MKVSIACAAAMLALGSAAGAQNSQDGTHHDLGGSMGTQSSATPKSTSASVASGAHGTPVAKAGRHNAHKAAHRMKHATPTSTATSGTATSGSADMTASGNATANQQH